MVLRPVESSDSRDRARCCGSESMELGLGTASHKFYEFGLDAVEISDSRVGARYCGDLRSMKWD